MNRVLCFALGAAALYGVQYFTGALVPKKSKAHG